MYIYQNLKNTKFSCGIKVTLTALAMFSGTILVLLNPGLFWDDWLWINKSAQEFEKIGIQMGVWWSGYLSAILYGSKYTVIILRLTSFFCWIISGYVLSKIAYRLKILSALDSYFFFLIYINCHFALIRFLPSVAIYTMYIAAFWVAIYLHVFFKYNKYLIALSYALFVISFHLNSLILFYAVFLIIIFVNINKNNIKSKNFFNINYYNLMIKSAFGDKLIIFFLVRRYFFLLE